MKSSGDISAEPVRRQEIKEHAVTDLDLRNDENRPSLTSTAVAEERQDVSSQNAIDEMTDAITTSQPGQSMRTIFEIASACNVWFLS